jgi:8-oxo-dGTP pyrophosphatase MutT (NUDIX family)
MTSPPGGPAGSASNPDDLDDAAREPPTEQLALHSVSVAAVVLDSQRRVLLIQRADTGDWQIPGGVLERDEDVLTGLRREVLEETGLAVRPLRLTGVYKNLVAGVVALVFRCEAEPGGAAAPGDETNSVRWVCLQDARRRMTPAFWVRVEDAAGENDRPFVRAHDGHAVLDA